MNKLSLVEHLQHHLSSKSRAFMRYNEEERVIHLAASKALIGRKLSLNPTKMIAEGYDRRNNKYTILVEQIIFLGCEATTPVWCQRDLSIKNLENWYLKSDPTNTVRKYSGQSHECVEEMRKTSNDGGSYRAMYDIHGLIYRWNNKNKIHCFSSESPVGFKPIFAIHDEGLWLSVTLE